MKTVVFVCPDKFRSIDLSKYAPNFTPRLQMRHHKILFRRPKFGTTKFSSAALNIKLIKFGNTSKRTTQNRVSHCAHKKCKSCNFKSWYRSSRAKLYLRESFFFRFEISSSSSEHRTRTDFSTVVPFLRQAESLLSLVILFYNGGNLTHNNFFDTKFSPFSPA